MQVGDQSLTVELPDMEEEDAPGVPEWVVTYGDMMSLLLTFFIMLVSLSEIIAEKKYRAVVESIAKDRGYQTAPLTPPGVNFPANSRFQTDQSILGSQATEDLGTGGVKTRSADGKDLRIKITDEGTPQQVGRALVFLDRTSNLHRDSEDELLEIARLLIGKPNKIEIRAHTTQSAEQTTETAVEEIDLTFQRGHSVLALLTKWGIGMERIRITAAAGAMPPPGDDQQDIPDDRIEIYTTDVFSSTYIGPRK